MKACFRFVVLGSCLSVSVGCSVFTQPDSFTFVPDFPPDFKYELKAIYLPAKGETCSLPGGRDFQVSFNKPNMEYVGTAEIDLYRIASGCPMALRRVEVKVIGIFGPQRSDQSY